MRKKWGRLERMFDLVAIIKTAGYLGIYAMVFAESGLLIGLFLPGDSLLFTAGILASQRVLNIWILAVGSFVAAVFGDNVGYAIGKRAGPAIFKRENSFFFSQKNAARARKFYERRGGMAIVLARFIPIIRTFAPVMAGVGEMHYPSFLFFNLLGSLLWAAGLPAAGYFLGANIPDIDKYLLPIIALIIFFSVLPGLIHFFRASPEREFTAAWLKRVLKLRR